MGIIKWKNKVTKCGDERTGGVEAGIDDGEEKNREEGKRVERDDGGGKTCDGDSNYER